MTDEHVLAGAAPCRHCGTAVRGRFFDATGRVKVGGSTKPLFKGYTPKMQKDGITAPPLYFCPTCDSPDPNLTLAQVNRDLDAAALEFTLDPPHDDVAT